jgi:hypothetical protein
MGGAGCATTFNAELAELAEREISPAYPAAFALYVVLGGMGGCLPGRISYGQVAT